MFETVWTFNTARFAIELAVAPESDDPAGHFATGDDDCDAELVEFCREGGWHWFQARVTVAYIDADNPTHWAVTRQRVLGQDYLGACSYHGLDDFREGGYFRDMVRTAISEARGTLARMREAV